MSQRKNFVSVATLLFALRAVNPRLVRRAERHRESESKIAEIQGIEHFSYRERFGIHSAPDS